MSSAQTTSTAGLPTLLFRADAGMTIGTGHVMRGIGLAQQWQDLGGRAVMLMATPNEAIASRLQREKILVEVIDAAPGTPADAVATVRAARRFCADWIVVDGYAFDTPWLARVGEGGIPLALWTDYVQAARLPVSLLLNQNPHASESEFRAVAPDAKLLIGLNYAVLRREFRVRADRRRERSAGVRQLLVTLGGSDAVNATRTVLEALALLGPAVPATTVVVGANNPRMEELGSLARNIPGADLRHDVKDMGELIDRCDLALSAAGATLWELAYLGVPALATVLADNQVPLAAAVGTAGAGIDLGWNHALNPERLASLLSSVLADRQRVAVMSRAALGLVDGRGAERVCAALAAQGARKS
ncbi:MAG: UDP-2,4-diacetamido-2,4,6-trideoxy-beta-L-altropyranose hydrolase [Opitutus sp.]|nr:UDP-2,4-diacetamido-2,4,6-trideoxy-beta-L-altropyranose hydrolase [Opitutus sp.]